MKMWIISVEPMPSMISMPVACLNSWRVAIRQRLARRDALHAERIVLLPLSSAASPSRGT
jgi:hypothetical protein